MNTYRPPTAPTARLQAPRAPAAQQQQPPQQRSRSPWGSLATSPVAAGEGKRGDVHPLKNDWIVYYVHRPPGSKVIEYEKEIKKIGSFGSIESFWSIYAHLLPPSLLPPVTDLLLFSSTIRRPVWEELPGGGKWVIRLRKGVADRLWESTLLTLISDQFDPAFGLVGAVLSVRSQEDILSVWGDREGEGMGLIRDKLFELLKLPESTLVEYKSNKSLLESATHKASAAASATPEAPHANGNGNGREPWGRDGARYAGRGQGGRKERV